jgi:prevent-host-death family protein
MATIIGAYEAKTKFSELLTRVEAGEEITITRRDKIVARLLPGDAAETAEARRRRIQDSHRKLMALHATMKTHKSPDDHMTVKDLINEGRDIDV